jgi:hypothetical protein
MLDLLSTPMVRQAFSGVLAAWVMGQAIAFVYALHREKEAQKSFVQAIVAGSIIGAMLMLAIGNSLARGVGIFATMSLIRFRTNLRDPLDMLFIFAAFAGGIAAGTGKALAGFIGTAMFLGVILMMRTFLAGGGSREAELRVRMAPSDEGDSRLFDALRTAATSVALLKRRDVAQKETRFTFRVSMKDPDGADLVRAARGVQGVTDVAIDLEQSAVPGGGDDD